MHQTVSTQKGGAAREYKWLAYQGEPSLTADVLVCSERRRVEQYRRTAETDWRTHTRINGSAELGATGVEAGRVYRLADVAWAPTIQPGPKTSFPSTSAL